MREFALLQHIFEANTTLPSWVRIAPGDDMALIELPDRRLLVAVDQLVDGRHVKLESTPIELVGRKAIARSLSDIAAMAGVPVATLVAATLPPDFGEQRAASLFDAMRTTCEHYRCPLVGGDIAFHAMRDQPMVCSVTVLATPSGPRAITRSGARPGDIVAVTGPLGGSLDPNGLGSHLTFEPRIDLAIKIAQHHGDRLHAMIDISDGLGRDASHIAELSGVQIEIDSQRIPCNEGCDWRRAIGDGEDYELCFVVAPPVVDRIDGVEMIAVGKVLPRDTNAPWVTIRDGRDLIAGDELGWQHIA